VLDKFERETMRKSVCISSIKEETIEKGLPLVFLLGGPDEEEDEAEEEEEEELLEAAGAVSFS
jgi:hypothetical protein